MERFDDIVRAEPNHHVPAVLSREEVQMILGYLYYGTGIRLTEALKLCVKDLDFERNLIIVRDTKSGRDRSDPSPQIAPTPWAATSSARVSELSPHGGDMFERSESRRWLLTGSSPNPQPLRSGTT